MRTLMLTPLRRAALLFAVASAFAGCANSDVGGLEHSSSSPERSDPGVVLLTWEETMAAFDDESMRLELPAHGEWSRQRAEQSLGRPVEAEMFEEGIGQQMAQLQWYCAWSREALARPALRRVAAGEMNKLPTLSVWDQMDAEGHRIHRALNRVVSRGGASGLSEYVRSVCP